MPQKSHDTLMKEGMNLFRELVREKKKYSPRRSQQERNLERFAKMSKHKAKFDRATEKACRRCKKEYTPPKFKKA